MQNKALSGVPVQEEELQFFCLNPRRSRENFEDAKTFDGPSFQASLYSQG
jgi:hypothetical protein